MSATIDRLYEYPLVNSSVSMAMGYFSGLRQKSPVLSWISNISESSIKVAAHSASFIINKSGLQPKISWLDDVACRKLQSIEPMMPILKDPVDEAFSKMKNKYSINRLTTTVKGEMTGLVENAGQKASQAMTYQRTVKEKYKNMLLTYSDGVLNVADNYVEKYLPDPTDASGPSAMGAQQIDLPGHSKALLLKLRKRTTVRFNQYKTAATDRLMIAEGVRDRAMNLPKQISVQYTNMRAAAYSILSEQLKQLQTRLGTYGVDMSAYETQAAGLLNRLYAGYNTSCQVATNGYHAVSDVIANRWANIQNSSTKELLENAVSFFNQHVLTTWPFSHLTSDLKSKVLPTASAGGRRESEVPVTPTPSEELQLLAEQSTSSPSSERQCDRSSAPKRPSPTDDYFLSPSTSDAQFFDPDLNETDATEVHENADY